MTAHITKTWIEDGKLITEVIEEKEIYKRTWVNLTDEEIDELHGSPIKLEHSGALKWVRAIEAKLKEKNT